MKKKIVGIVLCTTMCAAMLAGCGSSSSSDTASTTAASDSTAASTETTDAASTSTESSASGDDTLSLAAWDQNFNIPAMEAAEKDYQTNVDPNFTLNIIEESQSSDIETLITNAAAAGDYSTVPDIVLFQDHYFNKYHTDYPDAWVSLEDVTDVNWDNFSQEKLSYSTVDGVHYGFPVDNGTVVMAYRTDLLEQAGYTIDDMKGISWEEFDEIGKKVYEATGKYLLCMDGDGNDLPYMMLQAEGVSMFKDGEPYITENETLKQVIEVIEQMIDDNVLYLANDWSDYTDQTIQGDMVAGVMNGNWIIPTIEQVTDNSGKWEITSMPTLEGGGKEGYASNGGSSLYITANCQNVELAKKFLAYTFGGGSIDETGTSITYDDALTNGGVITTNTLAGQSDVYNQGVEYFNDQAIYADIVSMGENVPVIEQSDYHYNCRTYIAAAIINIHNGADIDDELASAEEQLRFEMGL